MQFSAESRGARHHDSTAMYTRRAARSGFILRDSSCLPGGCVTARTCARRAAHATTPGLRAPATDSLGWLWAGGDLIKRAAPVARAAAHLARAHTAPEIIARRNNQSGRLVVVPETAADEIRPVPAQLHLAGLGLGLGLGHQVRLVFDPRQLVVRDPRHRKSCQGRPREKCARIACPAIWQYLKVPGKRGRPPHLHVS